MNKKYIIPIVFVLVIIAQWFVPMQMISSQESVLKTGTPFKFRTMPVDPNDPFRGKYITLSFTNETFVVDSTNNWTYGQEVYVHFEEDAEGYAKIGYVGVEKPNHENYLLLPISYMTYNEPYELVFDFPFNRFYMEESKAKPAETVYFESLRDTSQFTYALVKIKNGSSALENVFINEVPIGDLIGD